jgi:hypothetical protein
VPKWSVPAAGYRCAELGAKQGQWDDRLMHRFEVGDPDLHRKQAA